jgi:hypothetical protein
MADQLSHLNTTIADLTPTIFRDAGPMHFPIMEFAETTKDRIAMSDGNQNDLGRLYAVKHGWKLGGAGTIRPINPNGGPTLDTGYEARHFDNYADSDGNTPFPSAGGTPTPGDFVRTLYLSACAGNFAMPMHLNFTDAMNAQHLKQAVRIIVGAAEKTKRQDAQSYYAYRATSTTSSANKVTVLSRIESLAAGTHATRAGGTLVMLDVVIDPKYGTLANFVEGDEVDVVDHAGGTADAPGTIDTGTALDGSERKNVASGTTYVQLTVVKRDEATNTITLAAIRRNSEVASPSSADATLAYDNTHGWTVDQSAPPTQYDWIVPRGCSLYDSAATRPWLTHGVFDWLASSGTIMGGASDAPGLDLDEFPMFKSILYSAGGSPLDENLLNRVSIASARRFHRVNINDWQTTPEVLLRFKEEIETNTVSRFERTNMPFKVQGGWTVANYVTPQGTYRWWTSPYMHSGKMIGQQIDKANLKLYSTSLVGSEKSGFAPDIQFVGQMLGYPTAKVPETALNGTPKTISGMPWIRFALLCPIMPNGWLIDGLAEVDTIDFAF